MNEQAMAGTTRVGVDIPCPLELWESAERAVAFAHFGDMLLEYAEDRGVRVLGPVLARLIDPVTLRPVPIGTAGKIDRFGMVKVRLEAPAIIEEAPR